ncbi:TPA: trp operon leader peptide [Escherichia coli]|nr:trp operon leader peptide [Escherichia coli]EIB9380813.1 trp operon leader peptide [Shigella flexneri]EFD1055577.1 trp operon leader peptide [Escherichia coli]EII4097139.1 trp operon leader peptide [Shigella flexneri]HAX3823366.1 trp operon leader peptide [Escherichia coli]HCO8946390.1 trp operon leader peptide [Escherichia coli]
MNAIFVLKGWWRTS